MLRKSLNAVVLILTTLIFTTSLNAMQVSRSAHQTEGFEAWAPETTLSFINSVERYRPAIVEMLKRELDLTKQILEIGSGPLGGILHYLGDLENITPSEAHDASYEQLRALYPRAIKTSAQDLARNLTAQYDIIVLSNTMDCILAAGFAETVKAMSAMKGALKPGGKIIVLQYYNPSTNLLTERINAYNKSNTIALPYETSEAVSGRTFHDVGFTQVKKDKIGLALPHRLRGYGSIERVIGEYCNKEIMVSNNAEGYYLLLTSYYNQFQGLAGVLGKIANVVDGNWKESCGFSQITATQLFIELINIQARVAKFTIDAHKHKLVTVRELIKDGVYRDFLFAYSMNRDTKQAQRQEDRQIDLVYTVITMTKTE